MATPSDDKIVASFATQSFADDAADAVRRAGFGVERRSDGALIIDVAAHPERVGELESMLRAYGAHGFGGAGEAASTPTPQRTRVEESARVELIQEQLRARTRAVQTGEVTIRKELVTENRTIEVPVRREELVIEHHPVDRQRPDSTAGQRSDPLVEQLIDRLRHMQSGETLRIPIIEEEVVVHKRPVVVEEITLGKRTIQDTQEVSDTIRREEARIEAHGEATVHRQNT
jgi:uncharacterized protein (TIGR02271 family)